MKNKLVGQNRNNRPILYLLFCMHNQLIVCLFIINDSNRFDHSIDIKQLINLFPKKISPPYNNQLLSLQQSNTEMKNLKKGTLVFVHSQSYPPWPAQIQRKYDNGIYKVNFIGEKSYTRIQIDKIDLFTEERAKQIHSELEDKKLSKAIFVALKDFENRKKRGQMDPQLAEILKKPLPPLDLSQYKHMAKPQYKPFPIQFSKFSPSGSTQDNLQQIGVILDKIYDFIVLPVTEKMPQYLDAVTYSEKIGRMEQEFYKLKQLFSKEQQNYMPLVGSKEQVDKDSAIKGAQNMIAENPITTKKSQYPSTPPSSQSSYQQSKSVFIQKLMDTKIVQRLIMTLKAYESFKQQNKKQLDETINYLREKYEIFEEKFREEYDKKKLPSHKDRIMLEKFQNFQAYL